MQLSDWQLKRLRNAIRAYHVYECSHDGDAFTWKDVSEAIELYTEVHVPPERLRQFVEGVRQDDGSFRFPVPKGERLKAIYDFAVDPELELISVDELTEREFSVQAALRLLEYLDQDFDDERVPPPDSIAGTYVRKKNSGDGVRKSELIFEKPLENGVVKVAQTDSYYDGDVPADGPNDEKPQCRSKLVYNGWAILTPEDNLFLFLKNSRNGRNLYFFTLASDLSHGGFMRTTYLSVLHHDYPPDIEKMTQPNEEQIVDRMKGNILNFRRGNG